MRIIGLLLLSCSLCMSCMQADKKKALIEDDFLVAEQHLSNQLKAVPEPTVYPRTTGKDGQLIATPKNDWTEGFYPGCLWYIYEHNREESWKQSAVKWTEALEPMKKLTSHHDIGFLIYCSFGNGYRLTGKEEYKDVIIEAANSLTTRFSEVTGCIKSWNYRKAWNGKDEWFYPVIIDNMMNLELLYFASKVTGDTRYAKIATTHAETTAKNQLREDYSNYHVVDYDTLTGKVLHQATCQGFSDNSAWARGQAWAIYGYTMVYRETHDVRFLDFARKVSDVYLSRLPEDMIPYWDFNAPELSSGEPKDASASAITASALLELSTYINDSDSAFFYRNKAVEMLQILSSPAYQARNNKDAFLLHSVGHMNKGWEVDASISYADYYYLEALVRLKRLKEKQSVLANL